MSVHDNIKIKLTNAGYLMNYPYHMISDSEMCGAFLLDNTGYFYDAYPCLDASLKPYYANLVKAIRYHLHQLETSNESTYVLPDWVYTYMLGSVISIDSDILDRHDLLVLLNADNIADTFTPTASISCLQISKQWLNRTRAINLVTFEGEQIDSRPPTMFGEPHVIKSLRLQAISPAI